MLSRFDLRFPGFPYFHNVSNRILSAVLDQVVAANSLVSDLISYQL